MALFGNLFMILLIFQDTHLHTPILSQLPFIDLNYISTIVPKMACNFPLGNKYLLHWMWNAELLLHDFSRYRSIVVDIYGLWSLCGNLLSSSLSHQYQQKNVFVDDNRITDNGSIKCCAHTIYASRSLIADPGPSIISSVMSQPCWLWPALTPGSMSTQY